MLPIGDENRPSSRPYVNYVLIAINVVIFFFFFLQGWGTLDMGIMSFGAIPSDILKGERLWTLFTSMFMHADIMHIFGNMLYLWIFGDNIEDLLGHERYLFFYLVGGIFASFIHIFSMLLSTVITPYSNSIPYVTYSLKTPSVGASGAISAVLGSYMLLYPKARIKTLVFYYFITTVSVPAFFYLGFWFIYQLMMGMVSLTGLSSGVAFWAHIGGFFYGLVGVKIFSLKTKKRIPRIKVKGRVRPIVAPWVRTPLVDVMVEPDGVKVLVMLPGIDGKDVRVDVSKWEIDISAEHEQLRYHKRIMLQVPVFPAVENLIYRNGLLRFTLRRVL